jgi:E3 ubiquitin-protein ligase RNF115/126
MHQAGPQGPIPATDAVIEGLPRSTLDEQSIGMSTINGASIRG